jgi:hypothetical protein
VPKIQFVKKQVVRKGSSRGQKRHVKRRVLVRNSGDNAGLIIISAVKMDIDEICYTRSKSRGHYDYSYI